MITTRTAPVSEMPGVALLPRRVFEDERGSFCELFNARALAGVVGEGVSFVQDNHSRSRPRVLRGLHYQVRQVQGKLLHVARGRVFDVVVDLRRRSPTFGRWYGCVLDAANPQHLWVPPGLAHGFVALTEAEVIYKVTDYWLPEAERTLRWDDPTVGVDWPLKHLPRLSAKDADGLSWDDVTKFDDL